MPGKVLVVAPSVEPISLSDARLFLKDPPTTDDGLISALITSARKRGEDRQGRAYVTQTWDYFLDKFPLLDYPIELPQPPLQSVTYIRYTVLDGSTYEVDSADYHVDLVSEPGRVVPLATKTWPTDILQRVNGVFIRFVAGYGSASTDVPANIITALKELISYWYFNRDAMPSVPEGIDAQLWEGYARKYA